MASHPTVRRGLRPRLPTAHRPGRGRPHVHADALRALGRQRSPRVPRPRRPVLPDDDSPIHQRHRAHCLIETELRVAPVPNRQRHRGTPDKSRPTTSDRGHTVRTYSNRELGDIDGWISVRKTATKRRDARIAVGLAGGAGLRAHEMFTLRHSDIQRTGTRVQVTVGSENRRTVDVHDDWTWYFDDLLDEPPTSDAAVLKVTTTAGSFTKVLGELLRGPHPAPNLTRLRETWVIRALGTLPVADFLRQSGFTSAASLTRYLPYLTTGETNR